MVPPHIERPRLAPKVEVNIYTGRATGLAIPAWNVYGCEMMKCIASCAQLAPWPCIRVFYALSCMALSSRELPTSPCVVDRMCRSAPIAART